MQKLSIKVVGKVIHGNARGRTLGFPTANLEIIESPDYEVKQGVYAGYIKVEERVYLTAASLGPAKTFNEINVLYEAHILDFNQDIYDEIVELELVYYLRDLEKFESVEELIIWLNRDVEMTRELLEV